MPSKLLPTTQPSEIYLNRQGRATPTQYERITLDTAKVVKAGYRTLAKNQEELRGQVGTLSKAESNSIESLTKEVLGRAISILVNGNTTNMVDPIGALIIPINRALYAVNSPNNLAQKTSPEQQDFIKAANFANALVPKLKELGSLIGFELADNANGTFMFTKTKPTEILDINENPLNTAKPIMLFNNRLLDISNPEKILKEFDNLIQEITASQNKGVEKDSAEKGFPLDSKASGANPLAQWLSDRVTRKEPEGNTVSLSHLSPERTNDFANLILLYRKLDQKFGRTDIPTILHPVVDANRFSVMGLPSDSQKPLAEKLTPQGILIGTNPEEGFLCYRCNSDEAANSLSS
ncbi:MAG: hypothetical protein EBR67_02020 [Proteobacteria bacterium]|nr:hypothetical protein [Pseudomonadota bacterium]